MRKKTPKSNTKARKGLLSNIFSFLSFPFRIAKKVVNIVGETVLSPVLLPVRFLGGIAKKIIGTVEKSGLVAKINKILEIPYMIAFLPVRVLRAPTRVARILSDKIAGKLYHFWPVKLLSLWANAISGWIYNILNGTILLPSLWIMSILFYLFPQVKEKYAWTNICLEGRMYLVASLAYKSVTKIFLLVPIIGWIAWLVTLPIGYFLSFWSIWIIICPVETLMPFLSPTAFPKASCPGCIGKCELPL
jgi:hypothetical protein